jgi:hypothetical protein
MSIDIGKAAKSMGRTRPRDARRADPAPPKPVSKAVKRARAEKPFGIGYESKDLCFDAGKIASRWRPHEFWYESREQRDQALRSFKHRYSDSTFYRNHRAIERAAQRRLPSNT